MTGDAAGQPACHIVDMAKKRIKRPADVLERAKLIGDIATGQVEDQQDTDIETGKRRPTDENGAIISVNATQPNNDR